MILAADVQFTQFCEHSYVTDNSRAILLVHLRCENVHVAKNIQWQPLAGALVTVSDSPTKHRVGLIDIILKYKMHCFRDIF